MATLTVYPDATTGNRTCDTFITSGYGATMQIAHDTTTGDGTNPSSADMYIRALKNGSGFYLGRIGMTFDTSALGSGATISAAVLSLYGTATYYANPSSSSAVIVGFAPTTNNSLVVGDFNKFSYTSFASIAQASLSQSAYNDFTLDANGRAEVSKTGITRLGCIYEVDRAVTTIGTADNIMNFLPADTTGTSSDPKLVITYTSNTLELFSTSLYSDPDLIAYYRLEDVTDSEDSGTDYDLTNNGSVTFTPTKFNNGADFNGGNSLNNNSVLSATSYPRSFSGWSIFDSVTSSDRTIFSLSDGVTHYYTFKVRSSDSHIVFRSNNATQAADVDTGIVAATATMYCWQVIQHSATSVTIYINNTKTNDAVATFSATVSQFFLGYLGRSSVWYMDGRTDDVAIFNKALSSTEVAGINNGFASGPANLKSYNTNVKANIKSIDGNLISNIKSLDTNV